MDQDTASGSDHGATNNIMVFNLKRQPPGGMAGDSGAPHVYGLMPWSGAGRNLTQLSPEIRHPPDSRRMARPDFQMEKKDGDRDGWMHAQGFIQNQSDFDTRGNLDASSRPSYAHLDFDKAYFPQNIRGHHQAPPRMPVQSNESPAFPQTYPSDLCYSFSSHSHENLRPAKLVLSRGDPVSAPSQTALFQGQSQRGTSGDQGMRKVFPPQPMHQVQPMKCPEKMFKTRDNATNLPYYHDVEEEQPQELQAQRTSQKQKSSCSVQYYVPVGDKGGHKVQYLLPVKAQVRRGEAPWPLQSRAPVSFIKPQAMVVPSNPLSQSGTGMPVDGNYLPGTRSFLPQTAPTEHSYADPEQKETSVSRSSHYSPDPPISAPTSKDPDSLFYCLHGAPPAPPSSAAEQTGSFHLGTSAAQGAASSTVGSMMVDAPETNSSENFCSPLEANSCKSSADISQNDMNTALSRPDAIQHPEEAIQDDQNDPDESDEDVIYLGQVPPRPDNEGDDVVKIDIEKDFLK